MKDLEIFDKDGKALHIADVISRFIEQRAEHHDLDTQNVALYFEGNGLVEVGEIDDSGNYIKNIDEYILNGL